MLGVEQQVKEPGLFPVQVARRNPRQVDITRLHSSFKILSSWISGSHDPRKGISMIAVPFPERGKNEGSKASEMKLRVNC